MAWQGGSARRLRPALAWVLAAASVVTLPLSWLWWSHEQAHAAALRQEARRDTSLAPLTEQIGARVAAWSALREQVPARGEQLRQLGEAPATWARRTITVENQKMSRVEADQYLRELFSSEQSLFAPSVINIRAQPGQSIYAVLRGQDQPDALAVTLRADLYTRGAP